MITKVKYIKDNNNQDTVVHIVYNNDTSVKITTSVGNTENTDWNNVLEWVAEGNTIEEAD